MAILHNIARQNKEADPPEEENSNVEKASESFVESEEYKSEAQGGSFMRSNLIGDYFARFICNQFIKKLPHYLCFRLKRDRLSLF